MILLSHSNSSFAESPFFLKKKLPELEIIEPYSCMCVGVRESELLALITWIIYFCHPSLAVLNFQSWKVLLEIRVRLKGTEASEMTFQHRGGEVAVTHISRGWLCSVPVWDGDRERGWQEGQGTRPSHWDAPTWPSAIRCLACQLRLSQCLEETPQAWAVGVPAQHPVTQPCSLNGAADSTCSPGRLTERPIQGSWPEAQAQPRARAKSPETRDRGWPSWGVSKGSFCPCRRSETNAQHNLGAEHQRGHAVMQWWNTATRWHQEIGPPSLCLRTSPSLACSTVTFLLRLSLRSQRQASDVVLTVRLTWLQFCCFPSNQEDKTSQPDRQTDKQSTPGCEVIWTPNPGFLLCVPLGRCCNGVITGVSESFY